MATVVNQQGRRMIQFIGTDKKRRSIRLGKVTQRMAESVKLRIENMIASALTRHALDTETAEWVANLDAAMKEKLSAVGLIGSREVVTLKMFIDAYIKTRCDTKPRTHIMYEQSKRNLIKFFGENKLLRDITAGDADEFRLFLIKENLADNTVRRRCGIAKQFFNAAMRKDIIAKNPFKGMKVAVQANPSRMYFVTRQEAQKVIEACPDAQWRLIFALCRFGGLRCPSEVLELKWSDIDWERGRITVHSPKTEHHEGKDTRQIPVFPELLPHLQEVFDDAQTGIDYVITRYRLSNANLRTHLDRVIIKAHVTPWPKTFQNLRSTRETELAEKYPLHVVCAWMGNSQPVAAKHYLQVTEEHFKAAAHQPDSFQTPQPAAI